MNLFLKYSRYVGSGVPVEAPKPDAAQEGCRGTRMKECHQYET
ncbi:hypothetical protein [Desulfurococcus amylolyticus]|nr:hypothetical protein [Desulfurococcus amylolyticus]